MATHYEVLDISSDADSTTIKNAYRQLSKRYHPDITGDTKGHFFVMLQLAYETLSNEKKRKEYDRELDSTNGQYYSDTSQDSSTSYNTEPPGHKDSEASGASEKPSKPKKKSHVPHGHYRNDKHDLTIPLPNIQWDEMDWYTQDYSGRKERVVNPQPWIWTPLLAIPFIIGMLLLSFCGLLFAPWQMGSIAFIGVVIPVISMILWFRHLTGDISRYPYLITGILSLALAVFGESTQSNTLANIITLMVFTTVISGGGLVAGEIAARNWERWSHIKDFRGFIKATSKDIKAFAIWGQPGQLDDAIDKFGERNVVLGGIGEKFTAEALEQLSRIPGTRIFHGLKFPGSDNADVDHAVINGNKIAFIDSKMWVGGDYSWDNNGDILRTNGSTVTGIETHFSAASKRYAWELPDANVRSRILIHSSNGRPVVSDNSNLYRSKKSNVPDTEMITPQEFFNELGNWFADGNKGHINKGLIGALMSRLK